MELNPKHIAFLVTQYSNFVNSSPKLAEMLADKEIALENGFEPISVTRQSIDYHKKKESFLNAVDIEQSKYLADLREIKLAHRKPRIEALIALFEDVDDMITAKGKDASDIMKIEKKAMILREIRAEAGEDVNTLAKALEKGSTITLTTGDILLSRYEKPSDETRTSGTKDTIQ